MVRRYLRSRFKAPSVAVVFAILLLYAMAGFIFPQIYIGTCYFKRPQYIELDYYSFFSHFPITFIITPLYIIWLQFHRKYFDNTYVVSRVAKPGKFWLSRFVAVTCESAVFLVSMYLLIIFRAIFGGPSQLLPGLPGFLRDFIPQYLCFLCLAVIFLFVSALSGSAISGFICAYSFVLFDFATMQAELPFNLFVFRSVCFDTRSNPQYGAVVLFMAALTVFLITMSYQVLKNKEYLK